MTPTSGGLPAVRPRLIEVLLVGVLGSAMISWWAWRDAAPGHPADPVGVEAGPWLAGLAGLILLLAAWLRSAALRGYRLVTATVWSVPMLLTRPVLSLDGWAYAAQGWLLLHGHNPYLVPQSQAGPLAARVDGHWAATTAVYPPGSLWIQAAMTRLADSDPYWSVVAMRIPAVVAMILIAVVVTRRTAGLAADTEVALWFSVTNPFVLLHIVGGMHNDGLQTAVALWSLWVGLLLARARHPWLALVVGGLLVGVSGTIKQPGVLAGLGLVALVHRQAVRDGDRDGWGALIGRAAVGAVAAVAAFAGISAIGGLGMGWLNPTAGNPVSVTSDSPIALVVQVIGWTGVPISAMVPLATGISLVLTGLAIVWCWWRWGPVPGWSGGQHRHSFLGRSPEMGSLGRPMILQAAVLTAFALVGAGLQPWYLIGPLVLVCLKPLSRREQAGLAVAVVIGTGLGFLQWFSSPFLALPVAGLAAVGCWWTPALRRGLDRVAADLSAGGPESLGTDQTVRGPLRSD